MTYNFKIGDVFEKIDTIKIRAKANDFPQTYSDEYCIPLLTAGAENQGFARYARRQDCPDILHNVISVSANGANSGVCFYQSDDFAVLQDAYAIQLVGRDIQCKEDGLYLACALNKAVRDNHDWSNKAGWNHIKDDAFELPVIPSSDPSHTYTPADIDWQYMRDRIAELERDRIAELDAYLKVTGLDDYTLTDEDKKILSNATQYEFKEFKVKDVFDVSPVNRITEPNKSYIPDDEIIGQGGNTPYIAAISKNNGITGYSYREPNNMGDCVTLSTTAASPDTVFYQPDAFIGRQQMSAFRRKDGNPLGYGCGIYLATLVRKLTIGFNYGNKLTNDFLKNATISLPVIKSSDPNHKYTVDDINWQYMEHYIRAIEKVVIADVVRYKDRVIEETRKLVSHG